MVEMIPILRPWLPSQEQIAPYLQAIDQSRIYSNFGPHACAFEERLASRYGLEREKVTTVANATLGLALALMAQDAAPHTLCVMPGWTFVASVNAAVLAGMIPFFVDVDPSTWALDPRAIEQEMARAPAKVGAVMVVAPFGRLIDYSAWDDFKSRSGIPVVIDAAAAFDSLQVRQTPAVVSLHATKVLGIGEGGFVACRDASIVRSVRQRSNFGFDGTRTAPTLGMNAKLSEYHAAVGLAALDAWPETRREWIAAAHTYRQELGRSNQIRLQPGFGETWISSTCIVTVDEAVSARLQEALAAAGIETRLWWGRGAHNHPVAAHFPRTPLPVTERLARTTFGIPFYRDIGADKVTHVTASLIAGAST
jgi:dTDP-4-amino-4,6-dideoxygalactose transaminase